MKYIKLYEELDSNKKILLLSLNKLPFDVMITGEKDQEFRKESKWIYSRLFNKDNNIKHYDYVKFINGYGGDKPYFITKYDGFEIVKEDETEQRKYSNGLIVEPLKKGDIIINLGKVIEKGNISE